MPKSKSKRNPFGTHFVERTLADLERQFSKVPPPPPEEIVQLLRDHAEILVDSFLDRIGRYRGTVQPAHIRREIHCLLHAAKFIEDVVERAREAA